MSKNRLERREGKRRTATGANKKIRGESGKRELREVESRGDTPPGIIYGTLPVIELLRASKRKVDRLIVSENATNRSINEIRDLARSVGIRLDNGSKRDFQKYLAPGVNHQGVIAFCAATEYYDTEKLLAEIYAKEDSLCLILDSIEDPRNLGAILRTAECVNVDGIFVPERRAAGLTETVMKVSAGALEYVKIAKVLNLNRLIDELKANGVWVVGAAEQAKQDYHSWDWTQRTALVMGNEGNGLHRLTAEKCDVLVKIPVYGNVDSLNVSVAAGIILYEARRCRES